MPASCYSLLSSACWPRACAVAQHIYHLMDVVISTFAAAIVLVLLVLHICEGKYNYLNQIEGKVNSEIPSCPHLFHLNFLGSHLQNKRQDMEIEKMGQVCESVQVGYQL